jgi:hypothetical protein
MTTRASHRDKRQHRKGLIMKTPAAQVTGRSPGEEHLMVMAGRHHSPRSGTAVKRLAAGTRRLVPHALRRDPQDRWAAVFGRIAGYSFAVAVVTGIPLLPLFRPSGPPWCTTVHTDCWTASP